MIYFIKMPYRYERIILEDILYIKAALDYSLIITTKKEYKIYKSISLVTDSFNKIYPNIVRIHNSFSININSIDYITNYTLSIKDYKIPVSRKYIDNLNLKDILI